MWELQKCAKNETKLRLQGELIEDPFFHLSFGVIAHILSNLFCRNGYRIGCLSPQWLLFDEREKKR